MRFLKGHFNEVTLGLKTNTFSSVMIFHKPRGFDPWDQTLPFTKEEGNLQFSASLVSGEQQVEPCRALIADVT